MKMPRLPGWARWLAIAASGALVLAAAAGDGEPAPEVSAEAKLRQAASRPGQIAVAGAASPQLDVERLERRPPAADPIGDIFGATNWYVPPPPPPPQAMPAPPPPPAPTAPALPFAYLGTYAEATVPVLILAKGDRVYTVSPGDTIEGTYRVESVSGRDAELTYLPLNIRQKLAGGGI